MNQEVAREAQRRGHGYAVHRPSRVFLQVTPVCNLACTFCDLSLPAPEDSDKAGFRPLSPAVFDLLAENVFPYAREIWFGVSGEPTLSRHIVPFLEKAATFGAEIRMITNGTRLHQPEIAQAVADHVTDLTISIDAASAEIYEDVRIKGDWDGLLHSLSCFDRIRMGKPPGSRGRLSLSFVMMRVNAHELPAFVELAHSLHADIVFPRQLIPVSAAMNDQAPVLDEDLRTQVLEPAVRAARERGISLPFPPAFGELLTGSGSQEGVPDSARSRRRAPWCQFPADAVVVMGDGAIYPCCHGVAMPKMRLGDLRLQSFEEIWNSRLYRNLRVDSARGQPPPVCRTCSMAEGAGLQVEDPEAMARCPDLTSYYGELDLDPIPGV